MKPAISKRKFYILSWTWGLPLTLIGGMVALILIFFGYKPKKWDYCYYFEIGKEWGGMELGMFFLTDRRSRSEIKCHEHGHGIQNCYWGFLMPFVICLPSAIRYWSRKIFSRVSPEKYTRLAHYDAVWFEAQATDFGTELHRQLSDRQTR